MQVCDIVNVSSSEDAKEKFRKKQNFRFPDDSIVAIIGEI